MSTNPTPRTIANYFEGATNTADGIQAGLSRTWYGQGKIELVTLDNNGSTAVIMEQREHGIAGAQWVKAGDVTRASVQRLNLFASGYEYRARAIESSPAQPLRLTVRRLDQIHASMHEMLVQAFARGHIVGFADPDNNGVIDYGDVAALKETSAFMFYCFDKDPALQATFGGAWEKFGVDYRKLHVNGAQFLLSTAIDAFIDSGGAGIGGGINTGGGGTETGGSSGGSTGGTGGNGGGTPGQIGGPPAVRTGPPSLVPPPQQSISLEIYSSSLGEALWGDAIDEDPALDRYELALNGVVIETNSTSNSFIISPLSPETQYELSVVRYREDGSYAPAVTDVNTTPVQGGNAPNGGVGGGGTGGNQGNEGNNGSTGGTNGPTDTDVMGTPTTFNFNVIDAHDFSFTEQGQGNPSQAWLQNNGLPGFTGNGYLRSSSVNSIIGNGAIAQYVNQEVNETADRRMWVRCRADTAGDNFGICSHGNGGTSQITVNSVDWVWIEATNPWVALDASMQLLGGSDGISIDKVIVQDINDPAIPSGSDGLVRA